MATDGVEASDGARRAALIGAMVAAVRAEGPAASIDALSRAAGVSKSVLYNHFADGDGLRSAVGDAVADEWGDRLLTGRSRGADPAERRAAVEAFVVLAETEPQLYELVRSGGGPKAVSRRVERIGAGVVAAVAPADTDPNPATAAAAGGALLATVDQWLWQGATDRDTLVDTLLTFVRRGLHHPPPA